eukprot:4330292-Lingulodinium_polyedra.AAC.1
MPGVLAVRHAADLARCVLVGPARRGRWGVLPVWLRAVVYFPGPPRSQAYLGCFHRNGSDARA